MKDNKLTPDHIAYAITGLGFVILILVVILVEPISSKEERCHEQGLYPHKLDGSFKVICRELPQAKF